MIFWTIVAVCILSVFIWFVRRRSPRGPNIPGPSSWRSILSIFRDSLKAFTVNLLNNSKKYGKIYSFSSPLAQSSYVIHDISLIKEVMLEKSNDFINHTSPLRQMYHPEKFPSSLSLISIRDDEWKRRRRGMSPFFSSPKIFPMVPTFSKHVDILCDILSHVTEGQVVDLQQKFANLTADVLGETAFGSQFNSQIDPTNKLARSVADLITGLGSYSMVLMLPYWYKYPIKAIQRFFSSTNRLVELCRQMVKQRNENKDTACDDLLQSLIELNLDMDTGLIPESFLFLLAGHETTSTLLTWVVYLVSKHPEVEAKILEEIEKVLGPNGTPTADNIHLLEYLDCVIQETLRLYPPAVITERESNNEAQLAGYTFPKYTTIFIPIWAIHHSEEYWPNPEIFDPTRFDSVHKNNIHPFSWIPFGGGPRICIGIKFALIEAKVAIAKLYQKYSFKMAVESCKYAIAGGMLKPEKLPVKVIKRERH